MGQIQDEYMKALWEIIDPICPTNMKDPVYQQVNSILGAAVDVTKKRISDAYHQQGAIERNTIAAKEREKQSTE